MSKRAEELAALLKEIYEHIKWRDLPIELLERIRAVTLPDAGTCSKAHPHEDMNEDCVRWTQELLSWNNLPYLDAPTKKTMSCELWEKYKGQRVVGGDLGESMSKHNFLAALHEYGTEVRMEDAALAKDAITKGPSTSEWEAGHNNACAYLAAAITKEPLP